MKGIREKGWVYIICTLQQTNGEHKVADTGMHNDNTSITVLPNITII
jgi:hypothetical protein